MAAGRRPPLPRARHERGRNYAGRGHPCRGCFRIANRFRLFKPSRTGNSWFTSGHFRRRSLLSTVSYWAAFLDVAGGLGAFLAGLGIFFAMLALARTLRRVNRTLDGVDEQIAALGKPVAETLTHVGGIADTADRALARLSGTVSAVEQVAGSVANAAKLTQEAISPAIVNVGATLGGISAGLRRLVRGNSNGGRS